MEHAKVQPKTSKAVYILAAVMVALEIGAIGLIGCQQEAVKSDILKTDEFRLVVQEDPYFPTQKSDYVEEEVYYEETYYYEPDYSSYTEPAYSGGYDYDFMRDGVRYGEDGTRYTWYSQNVLPGGGLTDLNNNGRHVNEQGYVCDGDGYIACASNDYPPGTVIDTPFGPAKVYDNGCASGTVDIYTDF